MLIPSKIVVQGSGWRSTLLSIGLKSSKISVLPNWSSIEKENTRTNVLKSHVTSDSVKFVFCGWLVKKKGICEIVASIKRLQKNGRKFEFLFVGGGDLEDYVRLELVDYVLDGSVVLTGWVEQNAVVDYLSSSSVLVLPSYAEGFPNVILESLALGLPIISCDVGGVKDSVVDGYNGKLVEVGSVEELSEAMRCFVDREFYYEEYSRCSLLTYENRHSFMCGTESLGSILEDI